MSNQPIDSNSNTIDTNDIHKPDPFITDTIIDNDEPNTDTGTYQYNSMEYVFGP